MTEAVDEDELKNLYIEAMKNLKISQAAIVPSDEGTKITAGGITSSCF